MSSSPSSRAVALIAAVIVIFAGVLIALWSPENEVRALGALLVGVGLVQALTSRPVAKAVPVPVEAGGKPAAAAPTVPARAPTPAPAPAVPKIDPAPVADGGALRLLALLQEKGRLVDFVMEDIKSVSDEQVAAVARVVHGGCRTAVQGAFDLKPLREEAEGAAVTLPAGFDASAHRLVGRVAGEPPFSGTLLHRGWRVEAVRLAKPTDFAAPPSKVVAPAEVELR